MPFIKQQRRAVINMGGLEALEKIEPGDRCYVFYRDMVKAWKAKPGWTTAHNLYLTMKEDIGPRCLDPWAIAYELAWQVFFIKYVMKYEDEKEEENGTI